MTSLKFGVALPYVGARRVTELASLAEKCGWDGCFLGDAVWCEDPMIASNLARYGAGYDAYINPEEVEDVDALYAEWKGKGVKMLSSPGMTHYGCYEFVFEDIDGRRIGIGKIRNNNVFFANRRLER